MVAATVAAVAVSVATAGAAPPVVAGLVGSIGLTGFGAAVATGVGVGVLAGAAGGGTQALVSGVLSGKDGKTILKDTLEGIKGGAVTGAFTGGLTGGLGAASSSVTNSLVRHGVDTVGETVIDTLSDAAQGGQITPTSIGTSLLLNAVTEGVSSRTVRAPKADVVTTKPTTGGRLPMTVDNLQMFAEKPKAKPDFYVNPDGTVYKSSDIVEKPSILYHYTSEKGLASILDTGTLNPSLKANNPKDARYGNGQYFTDIAPGSKSNGQLFREFYATPWKYKQTSNYLEIDTNGLNVIKGREGVYLVPNESSLDITNRIVNYGEN